MKVETVGKTSCILKNCWRWNRWKKFHGFWTHKIETVPKNELPFSQKQTFGRNSIWKNVWCCFFQTDQNLSPIYTEQSLLRSPIPLLLFGSIKHHFSSHTPLSNRTRGSRFGWKKRITSSFSRTSSEEKKRPEREEFHASSAACFFIGIQFFHGLWNNRTT